MEEQLLQMKGKIPEFIIKLYLILEKKQYSEYICWNNRQQILIKNIKKLQDKILPIYFRHKRFSSFIRQLNMYNFTKISKILKERNRIYFKNQNFKKDQIQELYKIKRNKKEKIIVNEFLDHDIDQEQSKHMRQYRQFIRNSVKQIICVATQIQDIDFRYKKQVALIKNKCKKIYDLQNHKYIQKVKDQVNNSQIENKIEPILDSRCSIQQEM